MKRSALYQAFRGRPYQNAGAPARDYALPAVMLGAGLRVSEAVGLDVEDLIEDGRRPRATWRAR